MDIELSYVAYASYVREDGSIAYVYSAVQSATPSELAQQLKDATTEQIYKDAYQSLYIG